MMKSNADYMRIQSAKSSQTILEKRKYKQNEGSNKFNSESLGNWRPNTTNSRAYLNDESKKFNLKKIYFNGPGAGKYGRSSGTGFVNHDPILTLHPAYSMGRAERNTDFNSSFFFPTTPNRNRPGSSEYLVKDGPGPGKYARPSTIGIENTDPTLPKNPAFSIGRTKRTINFNANPFYPAPKSPNSYSKRPGPTDYQYEAKINSYKTQAPRFSIGKAIRFPEFEEYTLC